ncbi:hypothetical protein M3G03_01385 [Aestuariimicrobium sp. p3-SID1156]|uniref:hypothetical protein n=1 Tax=Aestuariimicrobium sp. p3-SID1156 TaxID=2916038 RepID=UPI00223AE443|nr:hypothetical protein [Aestuariimicrobium sp. p3-SID1156]MCT1458207.1 hypothetical protein [Aestuariimicrobium sp. p3-SID1156]
MVLNTFLFIDPGTVFHPLGRNMRLQLCQVQKDTENNPLFTEDFFADPPRRWEARFDNGYPNVIRDPADGKYKVWWSVFITDPVSASTPLEKRPTTTYHPVNERTAALAYAESTDGVHWIKPSLGLFEFEGSSANNLVMPIAHGTGISLDVDDPDPNRRYKMLTRMDWGPDNHILCAAFSPDGLRWSAPHRLVGFNPRADVHNFVFRDPMSRRYVLITRAWRDGMRVAAVSYSHDFLCWSDPVEILRGDGPRNQIYDMTVFRHHQHYLGLVSLFHEGDRDALDHDLVDTGLAVAWDLDSWTFAAEGQQLISRGSGSYPDGDWDCGCIFVSAPPIEDDGKLWFYWMGGNGPHGGFRETSFGRGWLEVDKFGHYSQVDASRPGTLALGPFNIPAQGSHQPVELLVEVPEGGSVTYELWSDRYRQPVVGFEREACRPLTESGWQVLDFPGRPWRADNPAAVIIVCHVTGGARLFGIRGMLHPRRIAD